jgi:hypothetical protein
MGFTEKEFNYAQSQNKPILSFIRTDESIRELPNYKRDRNNKNKLKQFKLKIKNRMCAFWTDKNDLSTKFMYAFNQILEQNPQAGWIRYERMSKWKSNRKSKTHNDDLDVSEYSFLDGYYIGYTIQDCQDYENGEKDDIFPLIADLNVNGNIIEGCAEIYYRGVGDVQFAKIILSGLVKGDNIEYEWYNENNHNHKGKMYHAITDHGTIIGSFSAYGVDKGNPVQGRAVYHKINI